jgi:nicotinate phosphoribosyltransferase
MKMQSGLRSNLTMLTDFYEITMANGYFANGFKETIVYFDMFFRQVPDDGGFAIMAGVQQLVEYLENIKFEDEDIAYLKSTGIFNDDFIYYLKDFHFCCDV